MPSQILIKLREILDLPIPKKPFLFKLFLPILFSISFLISIYASLRRRRSYAPIGAQNIICVGNVLIGGSGKSPLVQEFAKRYLEKDYLVAIASRGMSKIKTPVYCSPLSKHQNNLYMLSDENREHYEAFIKDYKNFFIFQNKNRLASLFSFQERLKKYVDSPSVFIMDDGLTYFACPRGVNFCVWQPDLLLNSPHYCLPIGPYREGFGKKSFKKLLTSFDYRVWARTPFHEWDVFLKKIERGLEKYDLQKSKQDIVAVYELKLHRILPRTERNLGFYLKEMENTEECEKVCSAAVVTGIAQPIQFINDLQKKFKNCTHWSTLFLNDHTPFASCTQRILDTFQNAQTCIFTLKDFYRWEQEEAFRESLLKKKIYGCSLNISLYDIHKIKVNILKL